MTAHRLQRVASVTGPLALFDRGATRQREQQLAMALPAFELMRRAGFASARLALALMPHVSRIVVLAGPGNNGGDGLEAAASLRAWGRNVSVWMLGDEAAFPADAAQALAHARAAGVPIVEARELGALLKEARATDGASSPCAMLALWIDALLGIGASRPPEGLMRDAIALLAERRGGGDFVLSIDVPSGLDVDRGQAFGDLAVTADATLSLLTLKPGLFTADGRDHAGDVWVDALGLDDENAPVPNVPPTAWLTGTGPVATTALRRHAQHKGSFGDVAVVGGAKGMVGAALLAARAALAAGAGRVYLDALDPSFAIDVTRPELMCRAGWWSDTAPELLAASTVVCGCGGGNAVRTVLPRLLALAGRLVLDADALNAIAGDEGLQAAVAARARRDFATVITPHPLEAARLLGIGTSALQADRLEAARRLAERYRCVVVLKGSGTVITAPDQVACINATGNASLASGGTGDVLAGWIGGHWAQQKPKQIVGGLIDAVAEAVAAHGRAAEPMRPGAIRAADLVERLHAIARGR